MWLAIGSPHVTETRRESDYVPSGRHVARGDPLNVYGLLEVGQRRLSIGISFWAFLNLGVLFLQSEGRFLRFFFFWLEICE